MIFDYKFGGSSSVSNDPHSTNMTFAPDLNRVQVSFVGKLHQKIAFREAISALHDVVVSDLRFQPKDKTEYKAWLATQEQLWLSEYLADLQIDTVKLRIEEVKKELESLQKERRHVMGPFNTARQAYFNYLYKNERDKWIVLDPVITVHPDELFFECFSQDESSYGKLSCNYNVFTEMNDYQYGTTNVDYSASLYGAFQKIRNYKTTELNIDPSGFEVATSKELAYKEVKIDVPDSWVRGFLQVSTAMTLPATIFELHSMDVFSLCQYLRRFKEKEGPRALRFILEPDKPIRLVFEPWYESFTFHRSIFKGNAEKTIRIWGRRRLLILERLIPIAKSFKVFLLGSGLPSFFVADLGEMSFTLGLSGWTNNDWSRSSNFDLMAPRHQVDINSMTQIFSHLQKNWMASVQTLAQQSGFDMPTVDATMMAYTQAGRVIFDLEKGIYRLRELTQDPIDIQSLRFQSEKDKAAFELIQQDAVFIDAKVEDQRLEISGTVKDASGTYKTKISIDTDQRMVDGSCNCSYFRQHQLKQGPCEHILASRQLFFERQYINHKN